MEKNRLAKGIEMVENEREIRDILITMCETCSEELYRIAKEVGGSLRDKIEAKELSRSTSRELTKYGRYLEEMTRLAKNLKEYGEMLEVTKAERAEIIPPSQTK